MKMFKLLKVSSLFSIVLLLVNDVYALGLSDITGAVETLQAGQTATPTVPATTTGNSLTGLLMQQLVSYQPSLNIF